MSGNQLIFLQLRVPYEKPFLKNRLILSQKKGVKLHRFYKFVTLCFLAFFFVIYKKIVSTFVASELRNSFYQIFKKSKKIK